MEEASEMLRFRTRILTAQLESAILVMEATREAIEKLGRPRFTENLYLTCGTNLPCARHSIRECERVLATLGRRKTDVLEGGTVNPCRH